MTTAQVISEIRADAAYRLDEFSKLTGLGGHTLRVAMRDGLVVSKVGRRKFVRGSDWLAYLDRKRETDRDEAGAKS